MIAAKTANAKAHRRQFMLTSISPREKQQSLIDLAQAAGLKIESKRLVRRAPTGSGHRVTLVSVNGPNSPYPNVW